MSYQKTNLNEVTCHTNWQSSTLRITIANNYRIAINTNSWVLLYAPFVQVSTLYGWVFICAAHFASDCFMLITDTEHTFSGKHTFWGSLFCSLTAWTDLELKVTKDIARFVVLTSPFIPDYRERFNRYWMKS